MVVLGVDLVVLYNHTSSAILDPYIHSFQQDALLYLYNWYHHLVQKLGNEPFFGNFVLSNDCLYRYMYRSDYIIMTDLDEVVVPDERYGTLPVLLSQITQTNISQYTLHRVCFPNNWPNDPLWIINSIWSKITTSGHFYRPSEMMMRSECKNLNQF